MPRGPQDSRAKNRNIVVLQLSRDSSAPEITLSPVRRHITRHFRMDEEMIAMGDRKIGQRVVVIGAGMAGLAAAGAVADYFEQVIVLERDRLPDRSVPRPGTPQSRHLHV